MMKWKNIGDDKSPNHLLEIKSLSSSKELESIFCEVWLFFQEVIIPENTGFEWDYITVEMWADSGRIIIYPASSRSKYRHEKSLCQLVLKDYVDYWEKLDSEGVNETTFEDLITKKEKEYLDLLFKALESVDKSIFKACKSIGATLRVRSFRYEGEAGFTEAEFLCK